MTRADDDVKQALARLQRDLTDLARAVLAYDAVIEDVARQRAIGGSGKTGAWSVEGAIGERLDRLYFGLMEKARAALKEP